MAMTQGALCQSVNQRQDSDGGKKIPPGGLIILVLTFHTIVRLCMRPWLFASSHLLIPCLHAASCQTRLLPLDALNVVCVLPKEMIEVMLGAAERRRIFGSPSSASFIQPTYNPGVQEVLAMTREQLVVDDDELEQGRQEVLKALVERGKTPMMVIELGTFEKLGHCPCWSENVTRELKDDDWVIFISHRWWGSNGNHPDTEDKLKYNLLTRGLKQLVAQSGVDHMKVCVWMDYACIDQDDTEKMELGMASLISYVARCSAMLVPVAPEPGSIHSFFKADHPTQLHDYGEVRRKGRDSDYRDGYM